MIQKIDTSEQSKFAKAFKDKMLNLIGLTATRVIQLSMTPNGPSKPGQPPSVSTGNLRSSIAFNVESDSVKIGVSANASYANVLEYGMKKDKIIPINARALKISIGKGKFIFRMSAKKIEARPFIRPGTAKAVDDLGLKRV